MALDDLINSISSAPLQPKVEDGEKLESGSIFDLALHSPSPKRAKLSEGEVASLAESLVEGYLDYFAQADATIKWIDAEREHAIWLDDLTLLVGRIDAVGQTQDGERFFLELKTSKPPWKSRADEWRLKWLMSPQSLTYGVIAEAAYPGLKRFTVRIAYKSIPAKYDYDWFRYSGEEVAWWRSELINIAHEIRTRRREGGKGGKGVPWAPNFEHCFKYGKEYVCPRFHPACSQLKWDAPTPNSTLREPHLEVEREFLAGNVGSFGQSMKKGVVILDATRVEKWMGCRERYRVEYELGMSEPRGEAVDVGSEFHLMLKQYHLGMIGKGEGKR